AQAMGAQAMGAQAMGAQAMGAQAMGAQGMGAQGMGAQGMGAQGLASARQPLRGAAVPGTQLGGASALSAGQAADAAAANVATLTAAAMQELNLDYADIKRLDPVTMQVLLIPFSLARALAGNEADNLVLRPGDRITLYTKQEVAVPIERRTRLVKVTGEVNVPGIYPVGPTETLTDVIARAGGLTRNAYVYGTSLVRESIRAEQQRNLVQLIRTMEADLVSQSGMLSQNLSQTEAQLAQGMLAMQRQTVERMRTIEVTGRIALDLDERAERPPLPSLVLEDGDSISIPTTSDFVSVFGAVDISSTLLYRPGARVRDYLDRAGLRAFADIENVVLLRADGTARTSRNAQQRGSFFSIGGADGILDLQVKPGDAILVPEQIDRRTGYTRFMIGAKDWTQLIYQFGLGAAAFKVLRQ
ncbi:MAG: SLBB domain-containing protein, partial [Betaproteobacteria bacterium]